MELTKLLLSSSGLKRKLDIKLLLDSIVLLRVVIGVEDATKK